VGDEQRLSPDEQLAYARGQFDGGQDLTLAVEEEFALLDPETLDLVNRFEELQAAARGTPLEESLAGELVSCEAEVRTGRCESFAEAAVRLGERRAQLAEACEGLGIAIAATGTHPWTSWKDVKLIDTPHYRRVAEGLQYVAWRNQTFVLHLHVGVRGADRAVRLCTAFRSFLPELLALSASSPFARTCAPDSTRRVRNSSPARSTLRGAGRLRDWPEYEQYVRFLYGTGSIVEHTQIWWSVRPHLAFPTVEIRICDGQPTLAEAQALSAFIYGSRRGSLGRSTRASRCRSTRTG
jgi:carboxylate-amine ligase